MSDYMTTIKQQVLDACEKTGEDPALLTCVYIPDGQYAYYGPLFEKDDENPLPVTCSVAELPEREFDSGFGGREGERIICFSEQYVYISTEYDGAENIEAVPRHIEQIKSWRDIPVI